MLKSVWCDDVLHRCVHVLSEICVFCVMTRLVSYPTVTSGYLPPPRSRRRRPFASLWLIGYDDRQNCVV